MRNIVKCFGPVQALKDVSLSVDKGEIHGLLGENGAGKSTLMNILAGTFPPTQGEIFFNGEKIEDLNTKKTQGMGIRFIHQELNLVNDLTVYENLFLGEELLNKYGFLNKKEMIKRSKEILEKMNLDIDPEMGVISMKPAFKMATIRTVSAKSVNIAAIYLAGTVYRFMSVRCHDHHLFLIHRNTLKTRMSNWSINKSSIQSAFKHAFQHGAGRAG